MSIKKFLLIGLLLFFLFPQKLLAQESQAILISPLVFDLSANPGDILKNNLRLFNPGTRAIQIKITVEDFVPKGEEGEVQILELEPEIKRTYSLASWVKVEPEEMSLEPRQEKFINFTIEVPKNAEPGGKYGSLIVNVSGGETTGTGAKVLQKVASLILLSISGEVQEKLIVKEFKGPKFQEYGPINFSLRLENQGTVHLRPRGLIAINNWRNHKVADLVIPQQVVMPGAKRIINISWPKKSLFGRFTATVVGSYGKANQPFTASWTFWVWPWKISLLILIIVILLLILIIRGRKRIATALKILLTGKE
jgi:hypothetical protein